MAYRSLPLLLLTGALALCVSGCPDDDDGDDGRTDSGVDSGMPPPDSGVDGGTPQPDGGADAGVDGGLDAGDDGPQAINFIHTNDEQSHMLGFAPNIDDFTGARDGAGNFILSMDEDIRGGVHRRARMIESLTAMAQTAREPVVVANGGDLTMGSLFHVANLFASPDYNVLTVLGYHVGTLGNHEFDFGPGVLAQMISQGRIDLSNPAAPRFEVLSIPLVVSNIRFSMSSPDDDALAAFWSSTGATGRPIQRTHIQTFGNVRVGFVGYMGLDAALVAPFKAPVNFSLAVNQTACTNDSECAGSVCIPSAANPTATTGNCAVERSGAAAELHFPALVADVASAVADVRAQGVDLVVAVSHAGVNERELAMLEAMGLGPENAMASEDILVALGVHQTLDARGVDGIDVIIGGHSHTPLFDPIVVPNGASGRNTYIVQAGGNGEYVGRLRLSRPDRTSAWTLDDQASQLFELNGTINLSPLGFITRLVLDGLIERIILGLEGESAAQAGDSLIFPGEQCDGAIVPNNGNCLGLIPMATGGTLACEPNRQLDLSGCTFDVPNCGNDTIEGNEVCDGTDLPAGGCGAFGYVGGTLGCQPNCAPDFSTCTPYFPSLLEIALNFQNEGTPIVNNPAQLGDLFFYILGQAAFDVGDTIPHNESNLANLVADSARWAVNTLDPDASDFPVEIAIVANGVIRDGIFMGMTGGLSFADLFRVLPLGISPQERTPGYTLVDFWLSVPEVKVGLEVGLSRGLVGDSFWLGISGARVFYDLSLPEFDPANPFTTGRVVRIELLPPGGDAWDDSLAGEVIFDLTAQPPFDPARFVHVTTSLYIALFMEGFGLCPRTNETGTQFVGCRACTGDGDCPLAGSRCNTTAGRCQGGAPAPFALRTTVPIQVDVLGQQQLFFFQELKEFLALTTYIRNLPDNGTLPAVYDAATPRRMCCIGAQCPEDLSRTCN